MRKFFKADFLSSKFLLPPISNEGTLWNESFCSVEKPHKIPLPLSPIQIGVLHLLKSPFLSLSLSFSSKISLLSLDKLESTHTLSFFPSSVLNVCVCVCVSFPFCCSMLINTNNKAYRKHTHTKRESKRTSTCALIMQHCFFFFFFSSKASLYLSLSLSLLLGLC